MYRTLDADKVISTLIRLNERIDERFPRSGLSDVCRQLTDIAHHNSAKARKIAKPNLTLRIVVLCIMCLLRTDMRIGS